MPATRRKSAAATINVAVRRSWPNPQVNDRSRDSTASLAVPDRNTKTSSADTAIEEAMRSQPRSAEDICKLTSDPVSPSIAVRPVAVKVPTTEVTRIVTTVGVVGVIYIASYMRRIMTAAIIVGIIVVDGGRT
jgi:hypothetical protein